MSAEKRRELSGHMLAASAMLCPPSSTRDACYVAFCFLRAYAPPFFAICLRCHAYIRAAYALRCFHALHRARSVFTHAAPRFQALFAAISPYHARLSRYGCFSAEAMMAFFCHTTRRWFTKMPARLMPRLPIDVTPKFICRAPRMSLGHFSSARYGEPLMMPLSAMLAMPLTPYAAAEDGHLPRTIVCRRDYYVAAQMPHDAANAEITLCRFVIRCRHWRIKQKTLTALPSSTAVF